MMPMSAPPLSIILEIKGEKHRVYRRGDRFIAKDCEFGFVPPDDATTATMPTIHQRQLRRFDEAWDLTDVFVAYESEVAILQG